VVNQEKRLDWNGWDDVKKAEEVTVILKHMFTLEELKVGRPAAARAHSHPSPFPRCLPV
jgi:hypothetical protein